MKRSDQCSVEVGVAASGYCVASHLVDKDKP